MRTLPIGLMALLLAACASPANQSKTVEHVAADPADEMFSDAYRQIADYYVDPVSVESLATASIAGLLRGHGEIVIDEAAHQVSIRESGVEVKRLPEPGRDDAAGWAGVTSAAITAARAHDPALPSITDEQAYQRLFDGMISQLDPRTRYFGADAVRQMKATREGFGGVGITWDFTEAGPTVRTLQPDGPSARAGLAIGDRLTAIDDSSIVGLDRNQIIGRLRGRPDSKVSLTVERPQLDKPITVEIRRYLIIPTSVIAERRDRIAVFHVATFQINTAKALNEEVVKARAEMGKNLVGVVLDLRGSPGGLLDQAPGIASTFLARGEVISTNGRNPKSVQHFEANGSDRIEGLPLVVLVNGSTNSGAEAVATALQDLGRAVVVGTSTYGLGTVQIVLGLKNGGELSLTWARMITPAGTVLDRRGVVPTFCTSEPAPASSPADDAQTRLKHILDKGLRSPRREAARSPAGRTDQDWDAVRRNCPAETSNSDLDFRVAEALLKEPKLYGDALHSGARIGPYPVRALNSPLPPS